MLLQIEPHLEIIFGIARFMLVFISEINPPWGIASVWPKRGSFKTKSPFPFVLKHQCDM